MSQISPLTAPLEGLLFQGQQQLLPRERSGPRLEFGPASAFCKESSCSSHADLCKETAAVKDT